MSQEEALKFCREILKKVSRSFALTIPFLDNSIHDPVMVTYLQDRLLDNFEDEVRGISLEQRKYLMDRVVDIFGPGTSFPEDTIRKIQDQADLFSDKALSRLTARADLLYEANKTLDFEVRQISHYWMQEMNRGMQSFLTREVETFSDLDEYCYYVAGTVGGFLTETIILKEDIKEPEGQILQNNFEDAGRFLQKVNIIRDIKKDIENREKNYWPLKNLGLDLADLTDPGQEKKVLQGLECMIENVLTHVPGLLEYYRALPDGLSGYRRFYCTNNALGLATLQEMRNNPDLFFGAAKVKVSKFKFLQILKSPEKEFFKRAEKYV